MLLCLVYDIVHGQKPQYNSISVIEKSIAAKVLKYQTLINILQEPVGSAGFSDVVLKFSLKLRIPVGDLRFYISLYNVNVVNC